MALTVQKGQSTFFYLMYMRYSTLRMHNSSQSLSMKMGGRNSSTEGSEPILFPISIMKALATSVAMINKIEKGAFNGKNSTALSGQHAPIP